MQSSGLPPGVSFKSGARSLRARSVITSESSEDFTSTSYTEVTPSTSQAEPERSALPQTIESRIQRLVGRWNTPKPIVEAKIEEPPPLAKPKPVPSKTKLPKRTSKPKRGPPKQKAPPLPVEPVEPPPRVAPKSVAKPKDALGFDKDVVEILRKYSGGTQAPKPKPEPQLEEVVDEESESLLDVQFPTNPQRKHGIRGQVVRNGYNLQCQRHLSLFQCPYRKGAVSPHRLPSGPSVALAAPPLQAGTVYYEYVRDILPLRKLMHECVRPAAVSWHS
ncbi:MAG: uncharacterized protein KVP18_004590 [Porospora cf. gigantea A]|nr:MAG: hypothetical protein KVP18_004590 [Porospora cf. gigantea A]